MAAAPGARSVTPLPMAGESRRQDAWWVQPLIVAIVLVSFGVYSTWAAAKNADYYAEPYLSPFYSPCIAANCEHRTIPLVGDWWNL